MNDKLLVAAIGVLGVLLGAGLTTLGSWVIERRRDKRATAATVRLLSTDLHKTQAIIQPVREPLIGAWGPERTELPVSAYEMGKGLLAAHLDPDMWVKVEGAILGVRQLEGIRQETLAERRPLTDFELGTFGRIGRHIDETIELLDHTRWMKGIPEARERARAGAVVGRQPTTR